MGSPSGERQKSEAVEEIISARAEMAFQVKLSIKRNISSNLMSPSIICFFLFQDNFSYLIDVKLIANFG